MSVNHMFVLCILLLDSNHAHLYLSERIRFRSRLHNEKLGILTASFWATKGYLIRVCHTLA